MNRNDSTPTTTTSDHTTEKIHGFWFEHVRDGDPRDILDKARNMTRFLQDAIVHGDHRQVPLSGPAMSGFIEILGCIAGLIDTGKNRFYQQRQPAEK